MDNHDHDPALDDRSMGLAVKVDWRDVPGGKVGLLRLFFPAEMVRFAMTNGDGELGLGLPIETVFDLAASLMAECRSQGYGGSNVIALARS